MTHRNVSRSPCVPVGSIHPRWVGRSTRRRSFTGPTPRSHPRRGGVESGSNLWLLGVAFRTSRIDRAHPGTAPLDPQPTSRGRPRKKVKRHQLLPRHDALFRGFLTQRHPLWRGGSPPSCGDVLAVRPWAVLRSTAAGNWVPDFGSPPSSAVLRTASAGLWVSSPPPIVGVFLRPFNPSHARREGPRPANDPGELRRSRGRDSDQGASCRPKITRVVSSNWGRPAE
jgi:hypothetical protein